MTSSRTIFVTGATGFIGTYLLKSLLKAGHNIKALHRRDSIEDLYVNPLLTWVSLLDVEKCFASSRPDFVIHLATCYGINNLHSEVLATNVLLPLRLIELANKYGCKLFLNVDSFFAKPNFSYRHMEGYVKSKNDFLQWINLLRKADNKVRFLNIRLEHVYGPGDNNWKFVPQILAQLKANEKILLTLGQQQRDFIYIDDVVSAFLEIIFSVNTLPSELTEIQLGSGVVHSVQSFVENAKKICKSSSKLHFGAIPYRENEIMYSKADISMLAYLGWAPHYDLNSGIKATLLDFNVVNSHQSLVKR